MASCSARSSAAAAPSSPKPALLTTISGSSPSTSSASPIGSTASRPFEIDRQDDRPRVAPRGDRVGELGQPLLAPRDQHELVAVPRELVRERRADAGRCAGDQRDRAPLRSRLAGPAAGSATRWRSSIALARGDAEQIGGAPDQIVLELGDAAVGIDDLPHHLDHAPAAVLVERAVEQAGEMIEVDRLVLGRGRLVDQLVGRPRRRDRTAA